MFCVYIDWKLHTWFCLGTKLFIWSYSNYCMIAFTQISKNCIHISKHAPTNLARDKSFFKVWSYCKIQKKNLKTLWFDSDRSVVNSSRTIKLRTHKSTSKPQTDYHYHFQFNFSWAWWAFSLRHTHTLEKSHKYLSRLSISASPATSNSAWGAYILKDIVCNGKKSQMEAQGTDFSICVFVYYSISCKYWVPLVLSFWRLSQWLRLRSIINI